jgi:hypothetical protein
MERPVSNDLMRFHRKEQMRKLRAILGNAISHKRINSFQTSPDPQSR